MIPYKDLFLALDKKGIRYLIAGGFAVNLHQVQRSTVDLDLILHMKDENLVKFIDLMESLGFVPQLPVNAKDFLNIENRAKWIREKNMVVFSFINPDNPYEVIDVFADEPKPFQDLYQNKKSVNAFGIKLPVLGLRDLIDLKNDSNRDNDLFDVTQLKKKLDNENGKKSR